MMKKDASILDYEKLQDELKACACYVFKDRKFSDVGKPEFLKFKKILRSDFKNFILSNQNSSYEALTKSSYPEEQLCMSYSLIEFMGSDAPERYLNQLQEVMLGCYISSLLFFSSMGNNFSKKDIDFLRDCIINMFPIAFSIALSKSSVVYDNNLIKYNSYQIAIKAGLDNLDLFNDITVAQQLLDIFFTKYDDIEITSALEYLTWLQECYYFLYVLLQQDCKDLSTSQAESIITFMKSKRTNLEQEDLFLNIAKFEPALSMILAMESKLSPENAKIYYTIKPLLFNLVLEILLPLPVDLIQHDLVDIRLCFSAIKECAFGENKLPEKQLIDIYIAMLALGSVDIDFLAYNNNFASLTSIIEIVKRIRSEVLPNSCYLNCAGLLSLIVRKVSFSDKAEEENFFTSTVDEFSYIFKGAMYTIAEYLYFDPDKRLANFKVYDLEQTHFKMNKSGTNSDSFFILINMYKEYKSHFPQAIFLLKDLYIIHLEVMDRKKVWDNPLALSLLNAMSSMMQNFGMQVKEIDFINAQRACRILNDRMIALSECVITEDDLVFWERLLQISPGLRSSLEEWSQEQRSEIDKMCSDIVNSMVFAKNNSQVMSQLRIAVLLSSILSKVAGGVLYNNMTNILPLINKQNDGCYHDLICQTTLIKLWLIEYIQQNDKSLNSDIMAEFKILPHNKMLPKHRLMYMLQLATILYVTTKSLDFFYRKKDLYQKIESIADFILSERDQLYTDIFNLESLSFDEGEENLFICLQSFIDKEMLSLIHNKIINPGFGLPNDTMRINYNVIPIEKISFSDGRIILCCDGPKYSFPVDSMPVINLLRSQVRFYKKKNSYCFFSGDDKSDLIPLKLEGNKSSEQALPDDELFALFESSDAKSDSQNKVYSPSKSKKKSKSKAKHSSNHKAAEDRDVFREDINPKAAEEPMVPESIVKREKTFAEFFISLLQNSDSDDLQKIKQMVQDRLGFLVDCSVSSGSIIFSLDCCKVYLKENFVSIEDLCKAIKKMPDMLLAEKGISSFAEMIYDSCGKVSKIKIAHELLEHFEEVEIAVVEGDLSLAIDIVSLSFLEAIKTKFKVDTTLKGSNLYFIINYSGSDVFYEISRDLKNIVPNNLWLELLKMHIGLLKKVYGGNVALFKLELYKNRGVVAVDRSSYLPISINSLKRVDVSDNIAESLTAFFAPMDKKLFKLFNILDVKMVEFILQLMQRSGSDILIYGHPVVECFYGEFLRSLGAERQPVKQLIVGLGRRYESNAICDMLSSSTFSATANGVNDSYIYCTYKNINITICLDREQIKKSIFYGDRFCGLIENSVMVYNELKDNPKHLDRVIDISLEEGSKILSVNSYALKVALYWCKIMGAIGGGIRKILERFNFLDFITSPELEHITWQEKAGGKEFLPEAKNYLQTSFHLMSADAEDVLDECKEIMVLVH